MHKIISFLEFYAPSVLRYGIVAVVLWFSLQQFMHASDWIAYVPDGAVSLSHLSAITLVYINAVIELVLGVLLLVGWQTRIVAFLMALHLVDIMYIVGYGEIGVRDFGLAVATFTIFMNGPDALCMDARNSIHTRSKMVPVDSLLADDQSAKPPIRRI